MEIGFIFSFVEAVEEGAFFRAGLIFFFLFDEQSCGEDFAAEVAVIEVGIVDAFVEDLELGDGEAGREQFEKDGVEGGFVAKLSFGDVDHAVVVEDEFGHFFYVEPFGVVVGAELAGVSIDVDEREVRDAEGSFDGVAVGVGEDFHLFQIDAFEAGQFFEDAVGGLVEAFVWLEESAHEAPVTLLGLETALDKEEFDVTAVEAEDDAINGNEHACFTGVFVHV